MENQLKTTCGSILKAAENIVVLTGAGISTESGIKDFRSRTGIYQMAPETILSLDYFYRHPRKFYEFAIENLYHPEAIPNTGHNILAKWEKEGRVQQIITQNIDGLHGKAGSNKVIEFHGTMKTATCQNCREQYTADQMVQRMQGLKDFYICSRCTPEMEKANYIKPDVVLFGDAGDWFTQEGFTSIIRTIQKADCVLVLGTSLQVTPFSAFPGYRTEGTPLIIINKGNTPYDHAPNTYVIQEPIGSTMIQLDERA
ncbi:NAD-dependent protein deacylase [Mesobacillus foraminis]|uniref:NAD-dependent protein deacylase n=1 Tax=Mesobacillus foraminis TaxID=279826 RepID=UPI000EF4809B|nr:NAD-dependent protein deacylase [Mesobacillus foraminis]